MIHVLIVFILYVSYSHCYMMIAKSNLKLSNISLNKNNHFLYCQNYEKYGNNNDNNDNNNEDSIKNDSIERLQNLLGGDIDINDSNLDIDDFPEEIRSAIEEIKPSDIEVRLNLMGFNPLTYAGFLLAAILLFLNNVLGTGWAGDLLSKNLHNSNKTQKTMSIAKESEYNRIRNSPNFVDKSKEPYIIIEGEKIYLE